MTAKKNLRGGYRPGAGRKSVQAKGRKKGRFKMRFISDDERARYFQIGMLERVEYAIEYEKNKASITDRGVVAKLADEDAPLAYQTEIKVHFDADKAAAQRAAFSKISPRDRVRFALAMHETSEKFAQLVEKLNKQEDGAV